MSQSTIWWLIAGGAVVLELMSGTVYLLLLASGFAAAALAAHAGVGFAGQLLVAALVGTAAVLLWHFVRRRRPHDPPHAANRDLNLDIGERVVVDAWNSDGTATIRYRGAQWTVVPRSGAAEGPGEYRVAEVVGSRLVVEKI